VNKITATILLLFMPTILMAQTPQIAPLNKYQKAPFAGVLYNPDAVAEIVTQRESLIQQHQLFLQQLEEQLQAQCDLQVDNLSAEVDICNDKYNQMLGIKDLQIQKLEKLAFEQPNKNSHWWFAGGIFSGVLITVGIVYAVK